MDRHRLKYSVLPGRFAVCRLAPGESLPEGMLESGSFSSVSRTEDELSVVCPEQRAPAGGRGERGWLCFKLEGPFPFSQTGVVVSFISPLSERRIPVFVVSTYDTDYVLIKEEFREAAMAALREAGHEALPEGCHGPAPARPIAVYPGNSPKR
jgi:uncharacterized protein